MKLHTQIVIIISKRYSHICNYTLMHSEWKKYDDDDDDDYDDGDDDNDDDDYDKEEEIIVCLVPMYLLFYDEEHRICAVLMGNPNPI